MVANLCLFARGAQSDFVRACPRKSFPDGIPEETVTLLRFGRSRLRTILLAEFYYFLRSILNYHPNRELLRKITENTGSKEAH